MSDSEEIMADPVSDGASETSDRSPVLKLDAKELLEFVTKHTEVDRASFDRLLKWFGIAASSLILIATFFGYQSKHEVDATAAAIRQEAKVQVQAEVARETSQENIQKYINSAIEKRTEAQFQDAIAKAVASQLETPKRQNFLEAAVQRQVDLWFATHRRVLEAAAQRQVDVLTEHTQSRERILKLGDSALTPTAKSGPALRELQKLRDTSPETAIRDAASAEVARVDGFWGNNAFLAPISHIKTLDDRELKPPYPTCDLLAVLRSPVWEDRVHSLEFLAIRKEPGVPEALLKAMNDDYLEVAAHASKLFGLVVVSTPDHQVFPDLDKLRAWWVKEGKSASTDLKPLDCK